MINGYAQQTTYGHSAGEETLGEIVASDSVSDKTIAR